MGFLGLFFFTCSEKLSVKPTSFFLVCLHITQGGALSNKLKLSQFWVPMTLRTILLSRIIKLLNAEKCLKLCLLKCLDFTVTMCSPIKKKSACALCEVYISSFFVLPPVICTPVNLYLNITNLPQEVLQSIHVTGLHICHYVQLN